MMKQLRWSAMSACLLVLAGCGYTTQTMLPSGVRSVYVEPVVNQINLSEEISDKTPFRVYRPGLEVEIKNAIINRFIFDGTLRVAKDDHADAVIKVALVDYRRDALRYSEGEDVQEYRLSVTVDARLEQRSDGKNLWAKRLTGDTTFFLTGARSVTEDEATLKAVEDLARRVVESTIDVW